MINICKICNSKTIRINTNLPFFRHLDFKTLNVNPVIEKCIKCQTVFNCSKKINKISNIFRTRKYASSKQTKHKIIIDNKTNQKKRTYYQADYIYKLVNKKKSLSILDIGCFDGQLLLDISKYYNNYTFYGYDINKSLKKIFPNNKNFIFLDSNFDKIKKKLDLVILSHSIMYIDKIKDTLLICKKLLKKNGIIFIQIPNLEKNPFYSLMGDQFHFFTKISIKNVFNLLNLKTKVIEHKFFPRELIIIAKKNSIKDKKKNLKIDNIFTKSLKKVESMKKKLIYLKINKLIVLGTTINAAFVDEILSNKIKMFIDEQASNMNSFFRKKKIIHPHKLKENNYIILPYEKKNKLILKKFKNKYSGNFYLI